MRIAMFVFNPCTRDPRVDREAWILARAGHQVRVHAFLEPGLPVFEARNGYEVVRPTSAPPGGAFSMTDCWPR